MANLDAIHRYIEEHKEEHIAKVQAYLRQPSISTENVGVRECCQLVASYYRGLGCREVRIVETDGHPGIFAHYDAGAPRTIVNYCMYDVQPVAGETWSSPPFAANLVEMPPFRKVVMARGAINNKGQDRMWWNALESIIAVEGKLPVNIMFTAEGEEELGSPHFRQVVEPFADRLRSADAVLNVGARQDLDGKVRMALGVKGICYLELTCSGKTWGRGPQVDHIHGSMKVVVDSPAWRLVQALGTMVSPDGNTVLIDGFYDKVAPLTDDNQALIEDLLKTWDDSAWKRTFRVERWIDDLDRRGLLERYSGQPTLNIDGIWGGYTEPGGVKTILPASAAAKLDARLVPDMEPEEVVEKVRRHLDRHGFADIEVRQLSGYTWSKTSPREPVVGAVLDIYRKYGVEVEVWPLAGGSAPFYLYTKYLGLPMGGGGLGHGSRAHAPDEYLVTEGNDKVAGLVEAEKSYVDLLYAFAESDIARK